MLALPVSIQEAANPAFPTDQCKNLWGKSLLLLGMANLFGGNGDSHHCLNRCSNNCVVVAVSYTHLDVYKRQV